MKYITEDNIILESKDIPVFYTGNSNFPNGIYESHETQGSTNSLGIEQIKVIRRVNNGICDYTITESTEQELQDYLLSISLNLE